MKPRIVSRGPVVGFAGFSPFRPELERLETRTAPGSLLDMTTVEPFLPNSIEFLNASSPAVLAKRGVSRIDAQKERLADYTDCLQAPVSQDMFVSAIDRRDPSITDRGVPKNPSVELGVNGVDSPTSVNGTDKLDPPVNLSGGVVQSGGGYVDIKLKWEYDDVGAKLFHIDRSTTTTNHVLIAKVDYHDDIDVTNYQYLDRRLPQGPTYYYWVKAVNGLNQSPWSETFAIPTA